MAIVDEWTEADANPQRKSGLRYIRHVFVDSTGATHRGWLNDVPGEWGPAEWAVKRAEAKAELEEQLAAIELEALLNG